MAPGTTAWSQVPGAAKRVAAGGPNQAWAVNAAGNIYRWTGTTWQQVQGWASDIAVEANGTA
jgi:hypothetical protein